EGLPSDRQPFELIGLDRPRLVSQELEHCVGHLSPSIRGPDMADGDFKILAGGERRGFKARGTIFPARDAPSDLFLVPGGTVEIRLGNRMLEQVSENGIFGEMALIDDAPRSATVVALTDVQLVPIGQKQFLFLVSQTPHFALNVMRVLARRLRKANQLT